MKKLLQLVMVLALVLVPSLCFAQREFPDGTVLNDKEQAVYELVERQSRYFYEPASIRFKAVKYLPDEILKGYNEGKFYIGVTLSAVTGSGGRSIKTYCWKKDGYELVSYNGFVDIEEREVDIAKLNHLWKTYHADDE